MFDMKKVLLIFSLIFFVGIPCAHSDDKDISPFLTQLSNTIMENIYKDIEIAKYLYPGLEGFDRKALTENQHGIYSINFISKSNKLKGELPFEFGVTIVSINEDNFNKKGKSSFNLNFPLLGLKFAGYQKKNFENINFDIMKYIQEESSKLLEEQNKKMPILLKMETESDVYKVGEDIEIKISLENVTNKPLRVRKFAPQTLYFLYRNTSWGEEIVDKKSIESVKKTVLEPHESISKTFIVRGINTPQKLMVFCTYRMTYKGVSPAFSKKIKIVSP